ncbi:MAG: hypothetical protein ACREKE_03330, partial [bacterium]
MRRGQHGEQGMTLMELTFLLLLLSMAAFIFTRFLTGTRDAVSRQDASQYMLQSEVRSVANLTSGLNTCVELLTGYGDATGAAMQDMRNLVNSSVAGAPIGPNTAPPAPVTFSLWPTVQNAAQAELNGPLDPGNVNWGDELAYVAALNPITFTAYYTQGGTGNWSVSTESASTSTIAEVLSVGRYQFVYDYLAWNPQSLINGAGQGLRLTEWRSQPFVSYASLSSLTDSPQTYGATNTCCPRLEAACSYLSGAGYSYAFNPQNATMTASACFYALTDAAIGTSTPSSAPTVLPTGSWAYLDDYDLLLTNQTKGGFDQGRVSRADGGSGGQTAASAGYSVAYNVTGQLLGSAVSVVALQGAGTSLAVPAYAKLDDSSNGMGGIGFPAGFEIEVDGQQGSREAVLSLTVM